MTTPWPGLRRTAWFALLATMSVAVAQDETAAGRDAAAAASADAVQARTQRWADAALRPQREASAAVRARNESRIAAEVGGRLLRWTREAGEPVARGELLAEIDAADHRLARDRARASVEAMQARLALAERQLARAAELRGQDFVSPEVVNQRETESMLARAELDAARQQLAAAELALARTRVTAPFDAVVRQRMAQAGELVAPGAALYLLAERGASEVAAAVAPDDADGLRAAGTWGFETADGRTLPLRLLRVTPLVDPGTRTVQARLAFTGETAPPGAEGRLRWLDPRPHAPAAAMVRRDGRLGVFVVESGRARFVALPAAQEGRSAPLALPEDARLVVQGQAALVDGQPVAVAAASSAR